MAGVNIDRLAAVVSAILTDRCGRQVQVRMVKNEKMGLCDKRDSRDSVYGRRGGA